MAAKKLILTQKQLDEIRDGIGTYLDTMGIKSDMPDNFGSEVSAEGSTFDGYADSMTTDDFATMQSKDWPRDSRSFGRSGNAPANIREMSKKEWEERYIINENEQNGWKSIENMQLGNSSEQHSPNAVKQRQYRERVAQKKARSTNPKVAQSGAKSLVAMSTNSHSESYNDAKHQLNNIKAGNNLRPKTLKSAPKQTGNGKAHSAKNGIITPVNE